MSLSVPCAVYCKAPVDWKPRRYYKQPSQMIYVGSTSVSVARREWNRHAALRRLEHTPCTQAELSLRYWKSKLNCHNYTLFKLSSHENYRQAWVLEHQLIAKWQPRLNYPFVTRFLQRKALGFRVAPRTRQSVSFRFGRRLWLKLQRRLFCRTAPVPSHVTRKEAWELLFDLTSCTQASFAAAQVIRSTRFTEDEVYALIKLTHTLEQPARPGHTTVCLQVSTDDMAYLLFVFFPASFSCSRQFPAQCRNLVETARHSGTTFQFQMVGG